MVSKYGKYGIMDTKHRTFALSVLFSWIQTCELLTSYSTYIYHQINLMTSQGAIKVGEVIWTRYDSPVLARNTSTSLLAGRMSKVERSNIEGRRSKVVKGICRR